MSTEEKVFYVSVGLLIVNRFIISLVEWIPWASIF